MAQTAPLCLAEKSFYQLIIIMLGHKDRNIKTATLSDRVSKKSMGCSPYGPWRSFLVKNTVAQRFKRFLLSSTLATIAKSD
jgi:hypothetical protein